MKSIDKEYLVEELIALQNRLSVNRLYGFPRQDDTQEWLAELAASFKSLDEADYREIVRLSKFITPAEDRKIRIKAAHEIYSFLRRKIAEYKRYNFDDDEDNILPPIPKKLLMGEDGKVGQPGSGGTIVLQARKIMIGEHARISADSGSSNSSNIDSSKIVLNSEKIANLISELETKVEGNYSGDNKRQLLQTVLELKQAAKQEDVIKFRQLANSLLSRGADVAQIASMVIQLLSLAKLI